METQEQTYMDPAYYHAMMLNTDFMSQSLFQETACDECKAQHQSRHPGIHNFHAFLCYVLAKPISCCVYACSFIQRMIEFPLYGSMKLLFVFFLFKEKVLNHRYWFGAKILELSIVFYKDI
mgnify:CR=1 FL=1